MRFLVSSWPLKSRGYVVPYASTGTPPVTSSAGTIRICGLFCRERTMLTIAVPAWPQFMRGCVSYRQSLDEQALDAPRTDQEFEGEDAT